MFCHDGFHHKLNTLLVTDIRLVVTAAATVLGDFSTDIDEFGFRAAYQHRMRAERSDFVGHATADATAPPGDNNRLIIKQFIPEDR